MNDRLDLLFAGLAGGPTDRRLDHFEVEVARDIRRLRVQNQAGARLTPIRFVSLGLAMAVGVTVGSIVAMKTIAASPPLSPFLVAANLAPSTLLEDER
jgi:hypothetical protein